MASTNNKIELQAALEKTKSVNNINRDIAKIKAQIKQLKIQAKLDPDATQALVKELEKVLRQKISISNIEIDTSSAVESAQQVNKQIDAALKSQIHEIQFSLDNGHGVSEYQNRINGLISDFEKYGATTDKAKAETKSLQQILNGMELLSGHELVEQAEKFEQEFKAVKISINEAKLSYDKLAQPGADEKISSLIAKINSFLKSNAAITQESKALLENYVKELSGKNINLEKWTSINNEFVRIKSNISIFDKLEKILKDQFKQAAGTFSQYFSQHFSIAKGFSAILNQLSKMPKAVYEIDTAMTSLYKVTDETKKKYSQFLDFASASAYKLGRSISSLVEQTANWVKLGFSIDEAAKLAETSSIYANVGEVDDDTAISDIVAAMKAFNIEAQDSIAIVDSLNKLGDEFATDAKSLGEGLRNTASSMAAAGNDINQTLAILTGGGEITRNIGELSDSLRVASMRLRGMKDELQAIGEEYEDIESISKIQTQIYNLTNGSVNIFKNDGSLKSTYEQLKEISEVYFDLNDSARADLTEIMFGKNRANQGIAILQAFQSGQIQKAYEASVNSAGSAMQKQERLLASLEAKTQQFEAAFQSLSNTVVDSDMLKGIVDLGTEGVSSLEGLIKVLEYINSLFGLTTKNMGGLLGAVSGLLMNKAGIGERTLFQWQLYCAHPSKVIYNAI